MSDKCKKIDIDAVRLARLSRLSIEAEDIDTVAAELKKMADYTYPRLTSEDSALPFSYCASSQELREDSPVRPTKEQCDMLIALAPSSKDRYITVPRVVGDEKEAGK